MPGPAGISNVALARFNTLLTRYIPQQVGTLYKYMDHDAGLSRLQSSSLNELFATQYPHSVPTMHSSEQHARAKADEENTLSEESFWEIVDDPQINRVLLLGKESIREDLEKVGIKPHLAQLLMERSQLFYNWQGELPDEDPALVVQSLNNRSRPWEWKRFQAMRERKESKGTVLGERSNESHVFSIQTDIGSSCGYKIKYTDYFINKLESDSYEPDLARLKELEDYQRSVADYRHGPVEGIELLGNGPHQGARAAIQVGELRCDDFEVYDKRRELFAGGDTPFGVWWILEDQCFWIIASNSTQDLGDEDIEWRANPADRRDPLPTDEREFSVAKLENFPLGGNYKGAKVTLRVLSTEGYRVQYVVRLNGVIQPCPTHLLDLNSKQA